LIIGADFGSSLVMLDLAVSAVSWSIGFVSFWAIVFRSNRSATGGECVAGR
jgi:tetrahydromethanopterin S-methyltransferase subunit C